MIKILLKCRTNPLDQRNKRLFEANLKRPECKLIATEDEIIIWEEDGIVSMDSKTYKNNEKLNSYIFLLF